MIKIKVFKREGTTICVQPAERAMFQKLPYRFSFPRQNTSVPRRHTDFQDNNTDMFKLVCIRIKQNFDLKYIYFY